MDRLRYLMGVLTLTVMVVGGWFLFGLLQGDDLEAQYQVRVTFLDARGLKPGADVKFRGIQVGSVRAIDVETDGSRAIVLMTIAREHANLVRVNSRFWIVTPRFHGLASGVSGLETLVRDSFVAFMTPQPFGVALDQGTPMRGEEAPLVPRKDVTLPTVNRGDLLMRVLLPENHGVTVGARVMFRGMATGEVRSIDLAPSGTYVEVQIRVLAAYRSTVTDASVFWVSRPNLNLQFSLSNPVSLTEVGSLLSPYIAYYTKPNTGVPVHDGYPVAAHMDRPSSIAVTEVPQEALHAKPEANPLPPVGPLSLVRIIYEAIDVDWISPNDKLHRESTGILYVDDAGNVQVLTTRSGCDAGYFYTETFGEKARIENENIAVQLPGNSVLKATRIWVHPDGVDLAVLRVQGLPRTHPTTKAGIVTFVESKDVPSEGLTLRAAGERGVLTDPVSIHVGDGKLGNVDLSAMRGGVFMHEEKVVGILGQEGESKEKPRMVTFDTLPKSLRPVVE